MMNPTPLSFLRHLRRCNPLTRLSSSPLATRITPTTSLSLHLSPPWASITTATSLTPKAGNRREATLNQANRIMGILNEAAGDAEKAKRRLMKCGVTPTQELVALILGRCRSRKDWQSAHTFFVWARKRKGYEFSEAEYNTMIQILGEMKQFDKVWALLDGMRKGEKPVKKKFRSATSFNSFVNS